MASSMSSDKPAEDNLDIEDGEITDDDEEPTLPEPIPDLEPNPATAGAQPTIPIIHKSLGNVSDSDSLGVPKDAGEPNFRERSSDREKSDEKDKLSDGRERGRARKREGKKSRGNREDKTHRHMTEAERSILHLRKREKMMRERDKWDKHHKKESDPLDDDFAKNIEKTLATILNKKEKEVAALSAEDEVKEEEKRGKKRKKETRDKDRSKGKHKRMMESPRSEIDENEMLNIRSGSPVAEMRLHPSAVAYDPLMDHRRSRSPSRSEESYNSEFSSDEREERARRRSNKSRKKKENKRERRENKRRPKRDEQSKMPLQDSQGVCVFYMQGKCQKNDCPYSHEVSPPMKLELCKFYLMDCCAKGENCSYMHSEFPCKFYHTGLQCIAGKECKFAHGRSLSEGLKQILFKHIETAPRDILQGFPRLSRDEALNLINQTQKQLTEQFNDNGADQNTSTSTSSATHNITPTPQQTYGGAQSSTAGPRMYREEYGLPEARDENERDKEGAKGGIPSLFDITVPVPRELAQGLDFETKKGKNERHRNKNSRWQKDQETKMTSGHPIKGFSYGTDQDMRITSNGDVDMRTLAVIPPTTPASITEKSKLSLDGDPYQRDNQQGDVDIRPFTQDVDIRQAPFARNMPASMDVDIRQLPFEDTQSDSDSNSKEVPNFELPQATRDLLARITANQKDNTLDVPSAIESQSNVQAETYDDQNINWYSDDDDDDENRLTIKVEDEENHKREREDSTSERDASNQDEQSNEATTSSSFLSPPQFGTKTADIVGQLGDLSKIDISDEVTKLLTSMNQNKNAPEPDTSAGGSNSIGSTAPAKHEGSFSPKESLSMPTDPRMTKQTKADSRQDLRQDPRLTDPRQRGRQRSTESKEKEKKSDKLSIYEQGGIDMKKAALEIEGDDFKSSLRPDIDLRNMALPFKGMQNYTPATEIDASVNSHLPMVWRVAIVEIPRPDYTGLKLSINDAEKTGDPRLRKIFRLSIDEKDSPASPKASPKQSSGVRVDPRLKKMEEKVQEPKDSLLNPQLSYNQQLSMLQSSQFYQSLTSNQKLMLNQELARCDQSGGGGLSDPVLSTLLASLNLLPQAPPSQPQGPMGPNAHMGAAASILTSVTKINPLMPNQPLMGQQGLLGAAPGIPNLPPNMSQGMPPDYPMNFDPRGGGLLGNAPPGAGFGQFGGMDQPPFGGGYNDDFYGGYDDQGNMGPQGGNMGPQGGNFRQGRGYNNRDGRRRGNRDGFRGGRGNRHFNKRGGGRDKGDRGDRDRGREGGRGNRGHSPS